MQQKENDMVTYLLHDALTADKKSVYVSIQCKNAMDPTLRKNIISHIDKNMNASNAVSNANPYYHTIQPFDANNITHQFYICFIMTWDSNCNNVLSTEMISLVEY